MTLGSLRNGLDAFEGELDDLIIFNQAITLTDVANLYAADCWDDADGDGVAADVDCDDYDATKALKDGSQKYLPKYILPHDSERWVSTGDGIYWISGRFWSPFKLIAT